jgi:hypothetical protein
MPHACDAGLRGSWRLRRREADGNAAADQHRARRGTERYLLASAATLRMARRWIRLLTSLLAGPVSPG